MEKDDLASWFDDYGESILTYILLMVLDYQQAEDLTQETFMKAYRDEITHAINDYLQLPEIQEQIVNDPYTIKLLLKNKKAFITITNEMK